MAMLKDVIKKALEELSKFLQTKNRRGPGGWQLDDKGKRTLRKKKKNSIDQDIFSNIVLR